MDFNAQFETICIAERKMFVLFLGFYYMIDNKNKKNEIIANSRNKLNLHIFGLTKTHEMCSTFALAHFHVDNCCFCDPMNISLLFISVHLWTICSLQSNYQHFYYIYIYIYIDINKYINLYFFYSLQIKTNKMYESKILMSCISIILQLDWSRLCVFVPWIKIDHVSRIK